MKSNKGITLISLISSVILLLIIASVTIVTSVSAYNQMKFESAKAEIEEMQKLVDEIATDYQTYLNEQSNPDPGYVEYFKARYNADFNSKLLSQHMSEVSDLVSKFTSLATPSNIMFFFSKDDIVKYFDLKGINDVVVDFSTRTVYSVEGIKDPDDKNIKYYTQADWGADPKVTYNPSSSAEATVTVEQVNTANSIYNFKITINKKLKTVSEVYAIKVDGADETTNKIENFQIDNSTSGTNTSVLVTVTGGGTYYFRVLDSVKNIYKSGNIATTN